jgi:transcriptional regulator with XRE-family HTH domain
VNIIDERLLMINEVHNEGASNDFAARLNLALKASGMTQASLAAEIDASTGAVSSWRSGDRNPSRENVAALAKALSVPEAWLRYGAGDTPFRHRDVAAQRREYRDRLKWHFPAQQKEGRTLGNTAGFAFEVDLRTLTRETAQNAVDELLPGEQTVDLEYSVIELRGEDLATFLQQLRFEDTLKPHLVSASKGRQKAARTMHAGLKRLETEDRLILLQVADFNANGLTGPEYEDGRFTAVMRDVLNSQKGDNAGGSYGLGKATMWVASELCLVLANSDLSVPEDDSSENRFFGRVELPWHEINGERYAGSGWFGEEDPDFPPITRSYFGNNTLAEDLFLDRPDDRPGTTLLVVGAYDPSGEAEGIEEIAREIQRAAALNFWPAMVESADAPARLRVTVRTQRGRTVVSETTVDPSEHAGPFVNALRAYREGETVDMLEKDGDVVVDSATLSVPNRLEDPEHESFEQQAVVLVTLAAEDADERLVNRIAYFRGNQMVVREQTLRVLPFGARPFHAIVLAGAAAAEDAIGKDAERFLRAAEPPAHDHWTGTPELTAQYARGAKQRIVNDFPNEVQKAVKRQITVDIEHTSDGPDSLKELLRLVGKKEETAKRPRVKTLEGSPNAAGAWDVRVTVTLPPRKRSWQFIPVLKFGTETGSGIPVRWAELEEIDNCEVDGRRIKVPANVRTIEFRGVSDPTSHPVAAKRSTVLVDFRAVRPEEVKS